MKKVIPMVIFMIMFSKYGCCSLSIKADTAASKNSALVELGGNAYFYSINYERTLFSKSPMSMKVRSGIGYYHFNGIPDFYLPNTITGVYSISPNSKIECGGGILLLVDHDNIQNEIKEGVAPLFSYFSTGILGYRLSPKKTRLFFRIAYTPWLENHTYRFKQKINHWGGLSLGFAF